MSAAVPFSRDVLALDPIAEADRIAARMREIASKQLHRRGFIIAISGGVDSGVCAALAVRVAGKDKVYGLLLPERDSSGESTIRGRAVAEWLGIKYEVHDIAPALEALGCYRDRDAAMRAVVPDYGDDWKSKIVISGGLEGRFNHFRLVVQPPGGEQQSVRLPLPEYLKIVAATNFKQRIRKAIEYYHADRLNYAVIGTPNRLEYDQGFFVKNGDGSADVKPIAHLYKTQVYAMARALGVPRATAEARPTTDTYSLAQGQDEFYFSLPYEQMDLALWAHNHAVSVEELAPVLGIDVERAKLVYADIEAKRRTTAYLHAAPVLIDKVTEIQSPG